MDPKVSKENPEPKVQKVTKVAMVSTDSTVLKEVPDPLETLELVNQVQMDLLALTDHQDLKVAVDTSAVEVSPDVTESTEMMAMLALPEAKENQDQPANLDHKVNPSQDLLV